MNPTNPNGFGCDSFAEELSLFVFGELESERRDALERHLVECAACRGERDALVRSLELLKQEGERGAGEAAPQLSAARQANLIAQAQATLPKQGPVIAWRGWAVAAGLLAACVGAYVVTRDHKECESVAVGSLDAGRVEHAAPITSSPAPNTVPTARQSMGEALHAIEGEDARKDQW